jgi:rubredoxin
MACSTKHIPLPIPDEDWKCPACGAGEDQFYIDQMDSDDPDCTLTHAGDVCVCYSCHGTWTLKTIINKWARKKNFVICPHCKGKGFVEGTKEEKNGTI